MDIVKSVFGKIKDGTEVHLFTITNKNGMEVKITNYGGTITSIQTPDRYGNNQEAVLGFDRLQQYEGEHPYVGCLIGRFANRIDNSSFSINGKSYHLSSNEGNNHLHGGIRGFHKVVWEASIINDVNFAGVELKYVSRDGEEGYPGNLSCRVTIGLNESNEINIQYECETDQPTIVNLTHHDYFNLKDGGKSAALDHLLSINADSYTPVNSEFIPSGKIDPIIPLMDFRSPSSISQKLQIDRENDLLGGYDHNYVLTKDIDELVLAARLDELTSGRTLEVFTSQPGLQFYSGGSLGPHLEGRDGHNYGNSFGICLETQHFPDSPNHKNFPSSLLLPGQVYNERVVYRFGLIE